MFPTPTSGYLKEKSSPKSGLVRAVRLKHKFTPLKDKSIGKAEALGDIHIAEEPRTESLQTLMKLVTCRLLGRNQGI